jgi:hypothetical protein
MSIMTNEELEAELLKVRDRVRAKSGDNVIPLRPGTDMRPDLVVDKGDLTATAKNLRDLLAKRGRLLDNGNAPIYICEQADGGMPTAKEANKHRIVLEAHRICRPVEEVQTKRGAVRMCHGWRMGVAAVHGHLVCADSGGRWQHSRCGRIR